MTKRSLRHLLKLSALTSAALLALSARADLQEQNGHPQDKVSHHRDRDDDDDDDDRRGHHSLIQLATGQFVTPTAVKDAVQQYLNPGLPAYPNFIAGEAVRSQLSPDGATLAIITARTRSTNRTARSTWRIRRNSSFSTTWKAPTRPGLRSPG
jgi:hypothetical protein